MNKSKSLLLKNLFIESSLSRIWQHINNPNTSFAIISAYLDDENDEKNHKTLAKDIRKLGYGFIEMNSGYSYKTDNGEKFAEEKSYFIPEIKERDAIKLAQKYSQQSVIWKDASEFSLVGARNDVGVGKRLMNFKRDKSTLTFNPTTVKAAFSSLIKRSKKDAKFAFVAERLILDFPTSYIYQKERDLVSEWIKIL